MSSTGRSGQPIYLDYAATTPVDASVARAMSEVLSSGEYGNAASVVHAFGRRAQARIEAARAQVAALIGAQPDDVIFTSGATESNNLAILGVARANAGRGRHLITSRIEHKAVLDPCKQLEREGFTVTYLTPHASGAVTPDSVRAALRPDTTLVSIMHANNETGVLQDIAAIGGICREKGIAFHTDAAQSVGKVPVRADQLPLDLLSFTAHKLYGPQGIGALYVRPEVRALLKPITFGGGQERGLRPGTLPLHQIVGFGVSCELAARALLTEHARIAALRDRLWNSIREVGGVHLNGEGSPRLAEILNVSFEGVEGESLVTGLTALAVTTGSACSSASGEPSYVLRALGRSTQLAQSSLRFSLGRETTEQDVERAAVAVAREVQRLRAVSPASPNASATDAFLAASISAESRTASESAVPQARELADTLSPLARKYFSTLPGALTSASDATLRGEGEVLRGEAGSASTGSWIRFHLRVENGTVKAALFQGYGCPHTLAVTAWLTEQLLGRRRADGVPGTPAAWLEALDVPIEKLGRLLTVEDALKATLRRWA